MNIEEQFNLIAKEYDANRKKFIPCFDEFYEYTTKFITAKDIELWKERRKLDIECSVEEEMDMLRKCNFKEVKCIYSNQKFSVIVAIK